VVKTMRRVKIAGLGTYVPPKLLTNADLEKLVDTNNEWILQRTGIRERHIVDPGVGSSDLAKEAALKAMAEAGVTAEQVGFIVVGTTTPDMMFPSTACLVQAKIGAVNAWGFDLGAACSGFTYALTTAWQMVANGSTDCAIAVGADVM
jgi:3-oxoacyl-[acyl-carrier-protein] synthase III